MRLNRERLHRISFFQSNYVNKEDLIKSLHY